MKFRVLIFLLALGIAACDDGPDVTPTAPPLELESGAGAPAEGPTADAKAGRRIATH